MMVAKILLAMRQYQTLAGRNPAIVPGAQSKVVIC
jgi:hypothetical protein